MSEAPLFTGDESTALVPSADVDLTTVNVATPATAIDAYKAASKAVVSEDDLYEIQMAVEAIGIPSDQRKADELGSLQVRIGAYTKRLQEFWKIPKDAFFKMHRLITGAEKDDLAPWVALDAAVKSNGIKFRQEQQRIADEIARRKQREHEEEQERLRKEAAASLRYGEIDAAQETTARLEALASAPPVQAAPVKVAGMAFGEKWVASVTDPMALVKAIAAGTVPLEAIGEFNMSYLNRQATALKNELNWPGVTVTREDTNKRSSR